MSSETIDDWAITADGLGKTYEACRVGHFESSLREVATVALTRPWRLLPGLRNDKHGEPVQALRDASFTIRRGEKVGIIGRNGSGKSTLLKILARITPPTAGTARIRGRVAAILEVGTGFHPELTGYENIFLNGAILGLRRQQIEAALDTIVGFAELAEALDMPVKRYSSGMYVRLAFSVAAHLPCDVLLVDEVLAVGDEAFREKCIAKMQQDAEAGRCIVFVSHDMTMVDQFCDRCLLIDKGSVAVDADATTAIAGYRHTCHQETPDG